MADNVTLPGTGAAVRSDDVGGVQVQVVKVALGADGAEDTLIDSGQQTMANSVPVTLASNQTDVKITLDSEAVVLGAGSAAIGKLAANDGVDIGNVDVASIAAGDNNIGNVDIASAIPAGTNLIGKVSIDQVTANANEVVVKSGTVTAVTAITNALPAGDNNIGNVDLASSIPAGTNNIGDVDVLSVVPGTGATNLGKAEDAGHTSGDVGVMALGVRNEDGDDFSGTDKDYIPVAVNAKGSIYTVVRSALPAGTNAIGKLAANSGVDIGDVDVTSLPALAAGTNLIGKVSIDQVTANANEVVVKSALPAGTNAIGKLAANSGVDIGDVDILSIAAGDNNIGNVDLASAIPTGTNTIGAVKDAGPNQSLTRTFTQNDDVSTARDITAAPTSGQKIVATDILISTDTDCYLTIQMETSANVLWGGYVFSRTPLQLSPRGYFKGDAADKKLQMKSSVASKAACTCIYFSEA